MYNKFLHFTGAQGTGKTTLLPYVGEEGFWPITGIVRNLNKSGNEINKQGTGESQQNIFDEYCKVFRDTSHLPFRVSDRSLIDVVAYTKYLYDNGRADEITFEDQLIMTKRWFEQHPNAIVCYFPIEFEVVEDGLRSVDEDYRKTIDENIRWILNELKLDYYIIEGSIEERIDLIRAIAEF